jgi:PTS system mannose-specific IID component
MSDYKVTKADLSQVNRRYMALSISMFNYNTQNGPIIAYALGPLLRKLYPSDEEYKEAMHNHYKYFNSMSFMTSLILGIVISMEEKFGIKGKDAIQDFKAGIMGPTAGIGDSIFFVILPGIFVPIAASLGYQGNIFGVVLLAIYCIAVEIFRSKFIYWGYNLGTSVVSQLKDKISVVTEACSILGLTVVGALVPSVIGVTCPLEFTLASGSVINVQSLLDSLLPSLLPVAFTALYVKLLSTKKFTMIQLIVITLVVSIVLGGLGILG